MEEMTEEEKASTQKMLTRIRKELEKEERENPPPVFYIIIKKGKQL